MTTTFTARGPEDVLAAVPVVLGFRPETSLVMLTFGPPHGLHARVDLPPLDDPLAVEVTVEALLGPCRRHGVDQVVFVVYSPDARLAAALTSALVPAFVAQGIAVVGVLRAHAGRWSHVPTRADGEETPPVPYDDTHHEFAVQAVFEGWVTHRSRDELRATLSRDPDRCARWGRLIDRRSSDPPAAASVIDVVTGWASSGCAPDDEGAARVLRAVTEIEVRDALLFAVTRDTARDHLRVWQVLLSGAPDPQVPDTAALTAFCAWLAGHGALAWCALDRCFAVDPRHRLGACLAELLTGAVPPSAWDASGSTRPTLG
jgi:hypothetical protein